MMHKNVRGVLLAGGKSQRFGSPKAMALFQGKPYYSYSLEALKSCKQTIIVSHPKLTAQFSSLTKLEVIEDIPPYQGCGPLAGLHSAMSSSAAEWFATAPCDTPMIHQVIYDTLLEHIQNGYSAIIPIVHGKRQPLMGLYHRSCMPIIKDLLDEGLYRVGTLFERVKTSFIEDIRFEENSYWFLNINDEGEQRHLEELFNNKEL
ncbi:molybdenum cofactor guanylyltransferase [Bacillus solitudinis]|uniref:molybdenum cofactor guanylyltransferase n=1 Tax=Bacillus solitudinis TaxID=2014074 RepID=UPI000C24C90A|nr:molybdenum cofactor guanylyltransferase [Bacillus solitudinis]